MSAAILHNIHNISILLLMNEAESKIPEAEEVEV